MSAFHASILALKSSLLNFKSSRLMSILKSNVGAGGIGGKSPRIGSGGTGGTACSPGTAGIGGGGTGGRGCASTEAGTATSAKTTAVTKRVYLTMILPMKLVVAGFLI